MSYERKQRGITQSIYLIETIINSNNKYERKYIVMGSTGNVYEVTIKNKPTCTCPDFITRERRCKHIYFILVKVMATMDEDKKEYTKMDLQYMFNNIPNITNNLIVNNQLKNTYMKLKQSKIVNRKDTDDLCPICLDDLNDANDDEIDYCKYSCGKCVHKICYGMWTKKHAATCVFCNAEWVKKDNPGYMHLNL